MLIIQIEKAPAKWLFQIATRKAKAAAEAADIDWLDAHIKVLLPQRNHRLIKRPGHLVLS